MALCPKCGSYIGANTKKCRYCDAQFSRDQEEQDVDIFHDRAAQAVDISSSRMTNSNLAALTSIYLYPIEKIVWVVCLLLWLLGAFVSGWIFIPALLLTLYRGAFFYGNNSAKWRRFYFRLSMIYASVAGAHLGLCDREGIPFDPDMVWRPILQNLYQDEAEAEFFLSSRDFWRQDCDRDFFAPIMQTLNPRASEPELDSAFAHFRALLGDEKPSRKVLVTKAFLIQQHFSKQDCVSFWVEVFRGKLK